MDRQALLGQLLHIQQSLNTFVIQKVPKPQTAPINQLQRQNTDSKQVVRAYLPQLINYWKQLDVSKKESSFAYQQLSNNADKINDYLYQLKLLSQLKTEYIQVQKDFEQNYNELRDILEMKVKKLPHEVAQIFVNCQLSFERLALTTKNARQFIKQPLVFPNLEYFECNVFTDLLKRSIFNKQSLPTLLFLTNFGSMVQTRSVISKWYELGPFSGNQLDLMFFLSIDYSAPPNLALNLCQRFKRHLQFLIKENYTLDSKSVQQFVLDESEQLALFRVSYLKQNRNPLKFPFFGLLPKIFHFEHVPGYTISDLDYKLQLDHQNVQNNIINNNNVKLPSFKSNLFSKPPEITKISENEPFFNQFAQIKLKKIKIKPKTNKQTISLPQMFTEPERIEPEDSLETSPEQNKQMRIVKLPLVNEIGEFEPKKIKVKSARNKSPKVKIQQAEVKQEDSFESQKNESPVKEFEKEDSKQEKSQKNIERKTPKKRQESPEKRDKSPTKEVKLETQVKEDSFDDEPVQKEVKTSKTPKKEEAKTAVKPAEVKKEDSFDDEPVQKEVKTSKTPKKEEAKTAVKPAEVKKEDSFDDEPVQKEVKTSKTPKKEEAKAAVKPAEVRKEDSFDDEPVQKEVKTSKTPKKEEAKAAVKPAEVRKEDSFDDEPVQKEVKTSKTPKKEEAKAAVKPAEVRKEDSFDDEPVQKEVKTSKTPKKEEAKAAVKPAEVRKEDSFDDEPVQKEVKTSKTPKKEEAKAAVKPAEVKKEDSFDDEPVQKEVKTSKTPKKEKAKAAVKPAEVKKEDSFDDEPVQKEVKTSKTPKKEEAKAAVKPAEVQREDSFDDEPVQKEVKTSKTPKKEEAKAAVKPAEVRKEDSFDDEPVQKEVKTSKTPKKEEAKAAVKPAEVRKEDSFDDEPVQKEVKSAKPPKKEEAKAAVKPAEVKKEDSFDDDLEFSNGKEHKEMKQPVKEMKSDGKQEDSFNGQESPAKNINKGMQMKTPKKNSFESNQVKVKCARITSPMNEIKFQLTEVKQEQPQIQTQSPIKDVKIEKEDSFDKPEELQDEGVRTKTEYDQEVKLNEVKSLETNQLVNNKQDLKSNDEPKSTQKLTEQSYKSPAPNRLVVDDSFITPSRPADEYEDFVDNTSSAKLLQQVQQNNSLVEPQIKNQSTESKQKPPIAPIKSPLMANEYLNDEEEEQEEENEEYFDENTKNAFIDKVKDLNQIVIKMGQRTLKKRTREIKVSESAEGIFDEQVEKTEDNDERPKAREGRGRR
ncbi:Conserved_hypothetical protein [Hexamita inflata]|uniref:Uncharacterized protein n=1 Tax=Hexamita inflata TaxID=28002 RepID=A0AA86QAP5_9EUKA|nr:Conserved hypothetical protein [Hexamita inflata]